MSKVCPKCGREFENRSVRCPICKCDLEEIGSKEKNGQKLSNQKEKSQQPKQTKIQTVSPRVFETKPQKNGVKKGKVKTSTVIIASLLFLLFIGAINGSKDDKPIKQTSNSQSSYAEDSKSLNEKDIYSKNSAELESEESVFHEEPASSVQESSYATGYNTPEPLTFDEELSKFLSGGYLYITNDDLNRYCPNMVGVKVYVVTDISDIKNGNIQSTLSGGVMMSNFKVESNYEKYESGLARGDLVAICGTVSGFDDYGFLGTSATLEGCSVFAKGESAVAYKNDDSAIPGALLCACYL